jgi:hypothetical protein
VTDNDTPDAEQGADDDEGVPEVPASEKADVPSELAEKMADADSDALDDPEAADSDEPGDSEDVEAPEDGTPEDPEPPSVEWGEAAVEAYAVVLVAVCEELDDGDVNVTSGEIVNMARSGPIDLVEQAGLVLDDWGASGEMSPETAVAVGAATLGLAVVVRETDAAGDAVSHLSDQLDLGGDD